MLSFWFYFGILQPSTVSSTHLSAHPSSASPSETPNPFILYLSADEVVKLSFIPLPCPLLSLPLLMEAANPSILLPFFRYKLVKTKEILKSPVSFWLHPPFSAQTCLTLPPKSPTGLHSFTAACHVLMLKNTKMLNSHHIGWEKKPIHQQWDIYRHLCDIINVQRSMSLGFKKLLNNNHQNKWICLWEITKQSSP